MRTAKEAVTSVKQLVAEAAAVVMVAVVVAAAVAEQVLFLSLHSDTQ